MSEDNKKIVPFAKPAPKTNDNDNTPPPAPVTPGAKTYAFTFCPDESGEQEVIEAEGFLLGTSSFVGLYGPDGQSIIGVAPLHSLVHVFEVQPDVELVIPAAA